MDYKEPRKVKIIRTIVIILVFISSIFGYLTATREFNDEENGLLNTVFNNLVSFELSVLLIIIILFALFIIIAYFYLDYYEKIKFYKNKYIEIEKEKTQLSIILNKTTYKDIKVEKQETIINAMETFALNNEYIISVQLYKYSKSNIGRDMVIEVFPTSLKYTKNGSVANSIHERYQFKKVHLNQYEDAKNEFINEKYDKLENYISKLTKQFKKYDNKLPKDMNENDIAKYALLVLSLQLNFGVRDIQFNEINIKTQNYFLGAKRTGFLRSIIEDDYYSFQHEGNGHKGDRIYLTKCLSIENVPYMFVIILSPDIIKRKNSSDEISEIGKKFYEILLNDLEIVYNEYKVR